MSLTAGALSEVLIGSTTASVLSAAATSGTGPYTYQWYRSTTTGFTPGAGNIIAGATSLALSDTGLVPATNYFYKVIATDAVSATNTSSQLSVITGAAQSQNQFSQGPFLGMTDLRFNGETISVEIDASQVTALVAGAAVKMVDSAGGVPKVIGCAANSDNVLGFINFDVKSVSFAAQDKAEISIAGNVLYLISTGAIARGAQVTLDLVRNGGVASKHTGDNIIGYALDKATAEGQLVRVKVRTPSFTTA